MINIDIKKHAVAYPSNLLAQIGGAHIKSVTASKDLDNGCIVALGGFIGLDLFEDDGTVAGFEAKVVAKAANNNWYVQVVEPGNSWLVYTEPVIAEDYSKKFTTESNFYNAKGEEARVYELKKYDTFEVSDLAFAGTASVGASIKSVNANHKMVISA